MLDETLIARGSSTAVGGYLPARTAIKTTAQDRESTHSWISPLALGRSTHACERFPVLSKQKHHILLTVNALRRLDQRLRFDSNDRLEGVAKAEILGSMKRKFSTALRNQFT